MALRSPALYMGNPAVQHTAQNDRLMLAGLHRPEPGSTAANRPLTATSGVLVGPPGTMGEVTLLSNTQFTVNPARWVIYSSASALGGTYKVVNDAVETLGITAQNATQYRRSYFGVWVIDSFVAGAGDDLPHWGVVDGALAASAGVAALPSAGSLPANFLALGEFLIPPVGQAVTYTPYDVRTGMRGGVLPVTATDTRSGSSVGQYRDTPTWGLERWTAAGLWVPVGNYQGTVTVTPASVVAGPGSVASFVTAAMTVRQGQRLRIRPGWNWTSSTASAQTIQIVTWFIAAGPGNGTLVDGDTAAWRLPTASDITNGYLTTDVLVDITASGTITMQFNIQIGSGGNTITLTPGKFHYELGVPAP